MNAWQNAVVVAVARLCLSCSSGCDDTGKVTDLVVLDAEDLEPVCAFAQGQWSPLETCASVLSVLISSDSREVAVTADGYQSRTVIVSPVRFSTCGTSGGCNLVLMVKQ